MIGYENRDARVHLGKHSVSKIGPNTWEILLNIGGSAKDYSDKNLHALVSQTAESLVRYMRREGLIPILNQNFKVEVIQ